MTFWGARAVSDTVKFGRLTIDAGLKTFVDHEALPGTGLDPARFWSGFEAIAVGFTPRNRALLAQRDELQVAIDAWWREHKGLAFEVRAHARFLQSIGYLVPEPAGVSIDTDNVDPEISQVAGAQLVVPVDNARYALNAANARWVSLYDALYGTTRCCPSTLRPGDTMRPAARA
jgi:malate synthase